jgi:hypothetical protein
MTTAILSHDDLRTLTPSVFASAPWASVSSRYAVSVRWSTSGKRRDQGA